MRLNHNRLLFAFQPVVCAASGRIDYFECLLRMREQSDRLVTCGEFITATEQVGLIGLIDRYVLERAFVELAAHPAVKLGFNVSGLTACDRPWLRSLMSLLRKQPELAHRLVVEITETAALDNLDESARFVETLRHAGCRVALDDFGAGHTSLRHLQVLAVDTIKIDGSFVRSLAACRENRVILRHLLGLTRGFRAEHHRRMRRDRRGGGAVARRGRRLPAGLPFRAADDRAPWLARYRVAASATSLRIGADRANNA